MSQVLCALGWLHNIFHCPRRFRLNGNLLPVRQRGIPAMLKISQASEEQAGGKHGDLLEYCASTARELLTATREIAVLHGDIHHGNVLDFGPSQAETCFA